MHPTRPPTNVALHASSSGSTLAAPPRARPDSAAADEALQPHRCAELIPLLDEFCRAAGVVGATFMALDGGGSEVDELACVLEEVGPLRDRAEASSSGLRALAPGELAAVFAAVRPALERVVFSGLFLERVAPQAQRLAIAFENLACAGAAAPAWLAPLELTALAEGLYEVAASGDRVVTSMREGDEQAAVRVACADTAALAALLRRSAKTEGMLPASFVRAWIGSFTAAVEAVSARRSRAMADPARARPVINNFEVGRAIDVIALAEAISHLHHIAQEVGLRPRARL